MPAADEQPVRQFFVAVGRHDGRRGPLRYICPSTPAAAGRTDGQWLFWIDGGHHGVRQFPSVCSRRSRLHHHRVHRCQREGRQTADSLPHTLHKRGVAGQGQKARLHPGGDDAAAQRKEGANGRGTNITAATVSDTYITLDIGSERNSGIESSPARSLGLARSLDGRQATE